jgi:hypothetical protein
MPDPVRVALTLTAKTAQLIRLQNLAGPPVTLLRAAIGPQIYPEQTSSPFIGN